MKTKPQGDHNGFYMSKGFSLPCGRLNVVIWIVILHCTAAT